MHETQLTINTADIEDIDAIWRERWGLPIVSLQRSYLPYDVQGLVLRARGERVGLVTWHQDGERAELVTIDALMQEQGHGSAMLRAAEQQLIANGARELWLITTNDNLRALVFYLHRGYRLLRVLLDDMDRVRTLKPSVPVVGVDGVPLTDTWQLQKSLTPA